MRDLVLPVLALAIVGGLAVYMYFRGTPHLSEPEVSTVSKSVEEVQVGGKGEPAGGRRAAKRRNRGAEPEVEPTLPASLPAPLTPTLVQPPPPPFPSEREVGSGTPRRTVERRYGRPRFRVAGTHKGELHEHWVYVNRDSSARTSIQFESGRVAAARTVPQ